MLRLRYQYAITLKTTFSINLTAVGNAPGVSFFAPSLLPSKHWHGDPNSRNIPNATAPLAVSHCPTQPSGFSTGPGPKSNPDPTPLSSPRCTPRPNSGTSPTPISLSTWPRRLSTQTASASGNQATPRSHCHRTWTAPQLSAGKTLPTAQTTRP